MRLNLGVRDRLRASCLGSGVVAWLDAPSNTSGSALDCLLLLRGPSGSQQQGGPHGELSSTTRRDVESALLCHRRVRLGPIISFLPPQLGSLSLSQRLIAGWMKHSDPLLR